MYDSNNKMYESNNKMKGMKAITRVKGMTSMTIQLLMNNGKHNLLI